MVFSLFSHRLY